MFTKSSIFLSIFLLFFSLSLVNAQKIRKQVIGSGGKVVKSSSLIINGTIGQSLIGKVGNNNSIENGIGFWYDSLFVSNHPTPCSYIFIPSLSAKIGDTIQIPIMLKESNYFSLKDDRKFEVKIRYNSTVIQPVGNTPKCINENNYECVITINGSIKDSSGILYLMEFLVRLGNAEKTSIIVDSFKWLESGKNIIFKQDGELEILGICRAGDTIRLVKLGVKAGLHSISPNPSSNYSQIDYSIREEGETKILLIDNLGRKVADLFNGDGIPGKQSLLIDLSNYPNGLYNIVLITPTQVFSSKLLINK